MDAVACDSQVINTQTAGIQVGSHPMGEEPGEISHNYADVRSLLVVDDNASMRKLLAYYLRNVGQVMLAAAFDDALALARAHLFDGMVIDIHLGEVRSGVDLLHAIRRESANRQTPALACSAYDLAPIRECGFDLLLSKPFTKHQLLVCVSRLIQGRPAV